MPIGVKVAKWVQRILNTAKKRKSPHIRKVSNTFSEPDLFDG
jgi:hypothetical protein